MQDVRSIDPRECWVRHIVRAPDGHPDAVALGNATFVRYEHAKGEDGLNGRQGWQTAEATLALSDDGRFTLTLPNVAGDDGVFHRRRFAVLADDHYEPGEEWLEFWTDADATQPLFVGTPTAAQKSKSTVVVEGVDLNAVLAGVFSSDVDAWDAAAPADIFRHYSRIPVLVRGEDLSVAVVDNVAYGVTLDGVAADCWTAEARLRWIGAKPTVAGNTITLDLGDIAVTVDVFNGEVSLAGAAEKPVTGRRQGLAIPGPCHLRIVARYDRIFAFVAGELCAEFRRPAPFTAPESLSVSTDGTGLVWVDGIHVETLAPFAMRGPTASAARKLPGLPPPTGLRGRYWSVAAIYAQNSTRDGRHARLFPLGGESEPVVDRVDPIINFPAGTNDFPPGIVGAYAVRWSGAIYLDLAAADRRIRLPSLVGHGRIYVGRTLRGEEAASSWSGSAGTTLETPNLRAWLGTSESGWYPIVIEVAHTTATAGIVLEDTALDGDGTAIGYDTVPQERLSPIGCYEELVRNTPHRTIIGDVAEAFGYQWRVEHRSLESGEFPGQYVFAPLVGRQTEVEIDDEDVGTQAEVQVNADDVVDGVLADAAGIADPESNAQITAQAVDYTRAHEHMALRQSYEALSEISEPSLLQARVDSYIVLRGSPNEQVGVRPRGQHDLVDTFPLQGELAKMAWQPGDGVRLRLESIDVTDVSPRQMTSVTWPLRRDGIGALAVAFRQRPRSVKATMRRLTAAIFGPRRNYQGSLALVTGSPGNSAGDPYSRVPLPASLDDVVRATAVVQALSGSGRFEVSGVDLGSAAPVNAVGRYDITGHLRAASNGAPYAYLRILGASSYLVTLELRVKV